MNMDVISTVVNVLAGIFICDAVDYIISNLIIAVSNYIYKPTNPNFAPNSLMIAFT